MIQNYRDMAETLDLSTDNYTNEELFSLIEHWSGMSSQEDTENAVMEDIEANTKR